MVRAKKRSYRQESYDEDDSDSDYVPDLDEKNPKKYSLRKRTRQTLIDDYDYEVESDLSATEHISDDEDFQVDGEDDLEPYVQCTNSIVNEQGTSQNQQADNNGLIDFEDMIRADIVINKNRIDYDNVIGSNEIRTDKKRGRPPKKKQNEVFTHSILGPLVDAIVPAFASDIPEKASFNSQASPDSSTQLDTNFEPVTQITESPVERGSPSSATCPAVQFPDREKCESDVVVPIVNGDNPHNATGTNIHQSGILNSEKSETEEAKSDRQIQQKSEVEKSHTSTKSVVNLELNDADDVILIEETPDVIVLDD